MRQTYEKTLFYRAATLKINRHAAQPKCHFSQLKNYFTLPKRDFSMFNTHITHAFTLLKTLFPRKCLHAFTSPQRIHYKRVPVKARFHGRYHHPIGRENKHPSPFVKNRHITAYLQEMVSLFSTLHFTCTYVTCPIVSPAFERSQITSNKPFEASMQQL